MKKKKLSRLHLSKDTLRKLGDSQLAVPAGGYPETAFCETWSCGGTCAATCVLSESCYCLW